MLYVSLEMRKIYHEIKGDPFFNLTCSGIQNNNLNNSYFLPALNLFFAIAG